MREAIQLGTDVHYATALYDADNLDEASVSDRVRPYLDAWKLFRCEAISRGAFVAVEVRLYSEAGHFAGTCDRIIYLQDGGTVIVEIKTGAKEKWHAVQVAGYCTMLDLGASGWLVYLRPDGTYECDQMAGSSWDYRAWRACLDLWHWRNLK